MLARSSSTNPIEYKTSMWHRKPAKQCLKADNYNHVQQSCISHPFPDPFAQVTNLSKPVDSQSHRHSSHRTHVYRNSTLQKASNIIHVLGVLEQRNKGCTISSIPFCLHSFNMQSANTIDTNRTITPHTACKTIEIEERQTPAIHHNPTRLLANAICEKHSRREDGGLNLHIIFALALAVVVAHAQVRLQTHSDFMCAFCKFLVPHCRT